MEYDYDLSEVIIGGELSLATRNSVHGWVLLADRVESLRVELTGNACEELAGRTIRFHHTSKRPDFSRRLAQLNGMVTQRHIGVVGAIRHEGDCLDLEWYCQSGRIGARLQGFIVEIDPKEPAESCRAFEDYMQEEVEEPEGFEESGLFESFDDFLHDDNEPSYQEFVAKMEKFEETVIEGKGESVRIGSLFDEHHWPKPEGLTEDAAQEVMSRVLATLARFNVAFDMCPKCTWQHAYQLIHDKLADEEFYPVMKGSDWISHYGASDFCGPCQEEFEKECESMELFEDDNDVDIESLNG
ncbi:hypothetical protein BVY04_00415 [bacterium M21]|nr:hypothetical protein BVY04_00415 [bacterium M21]